MKKENQPGLSSFSERLKSAIEKKGLPVLTIAQLTGIKHQAIQYLCKSNAEKSKFTPLLAEALDVNVNWLANAVGPMYPQKTAPENNEQPNFIPLLTINDLKKIKTTNELETIDTKNQIKISGDDNMLFAIEGAMIGFLGSLAGAFFHMMIWLAIYIASPTYTPPGSSSPVPLHVDLLPGNILFMLICMIFLALIAAIFPAIVCGSIAGIIAVFMPKCPE